MTKEAVVVFNPGSRGGKSLRALPEIQAYVKKHALDWDIRSTSCLEDAHRISAEANKARCPAVIAVGGDGTIGGVISGFFGPEGQPRSKAKLGVIYTGTSPDFCKSYGLPVGSVPKAIEQMHRKPPRPISLGRIQYENQPDQGKRQKSQRYFACAANIGIGPLIATYANSGIRKWLGDSTGTFISLLRAFGRFKPVPLMVEIDGLKISLGKTTSLTIGKTPWVASGIQVRSPLALPEDQLYLLAVSDIRPRDIPRCLHKLYSGRPMTEDHNFTYLQGKRFRITSEGRALGVEFDGDPQGYLPCEVQAVPQAIDLLGAG
jgi:diacylglycerol kinase (ATP)